MLFVVSYGTFCKAPASSGLALDETHVSDDDYTIADCISEEQDSHASSSSLPSPAASAERKQSDTVSLEHKHSDKKKFADLLAHSVGESGSVKNFLSAAPPFRVHETAFIMFRYDHINKVIDDRHFEYIVADPSGPNRWSCSCHRFTLSAQNCCMHTLAAQLVAKKPLPRDLPLSSQPVIACNKANTVWAVLGGQGCYRAIVQLRAGVVSL